MPAKAKRKERAPRVIGPKLISFTLEHKAYNQLIEALRLAKIVQPSLCSKEQLLESIVTYYLRNYDSARPRVYAEKHILDDSHYDATPQQILEEFCRLYPDITVIVQYPIL